MSNELFDASCWTSLLLEIFKIKYSLIVKGTYKQDCEIKTREMLIFLHLKHNSRTIELTFLLNYMSAIISSNTIDTLLSFPSINTQLILWF